MWEAVGAVLSGIQTVEDMVAAFSDEQQSRRLLEAMVWPKGRICPACGYKRSIAIAGRDMGRRRARPGLYQCSGGECRFQFTATTHTPLHSTKLPLSTWLKALWLMLQSDKGLSSVRLAEALGVSQPTAWRMGHALRLMVAREMPLGGTVEIDEFYLGRILPWWPAEAKSRCSAAGARPQGPAANHEGSRVGGGAETERYHCWHASRRCPRQGGGRSLGHRG